MNKKSRESEIWRNKWKYQREQKLYVENYWNKSNAKQLISIKGLKKMY